MIHRAKVGKRKLLFNTPEEESAFYDKEYEKEVTIERIKRARTLSQNAYYWVYLTIIAKETGNNADDMHELFKSMFLPDVIVKIKGKKHSHDFKRKKSTTELTRVEFTEYMERIAAYTEVPMPNPEDAGYFQ